MSRIQQTSGTVEPDHGGSRQAILVAARDLFAQRGFKQVTVRDIAAQAGTSPSLVMKLGGSKEALFQQTATIIPPPLPEVPVAELGAALVNDLVDRHERGDLEHLARILMLRLTAPDPGAVEARFFKGYVEPLCAVLAGPQARMRAELVVGALSGLAALLRVFKAPAALAETQAVRETYGRAVQQLIDNTPDPRDPDR